MVGHLNPLLSIARLLVERGHAVVGHTASAHRYRFERIGAGFQPFSGPLDQDLSDLDTVYPELKTLDDGPEKLRFLFRHAFIDRLGAQSLSLRALLDQQPADLVLCDNLFLGTYPLLLGRRQDRPAIVHCGVTPLFTSRDDGAPSGIGLPPAVNDEDRTQYRLIRQMVEQEFLHPIQQAFDRQLEAIGCVPPAVPMNDASVSLPDLYLQPTVQEFEYPRAEPPPSLRFIGALPLPATEISLPDWAGDVDAAAQVVLVTQGTLANHDLGQLIGPTIEALRDRPDVLLVVTTGGRPLDAVPGPIGENVRLAEFLPFDWLMPRIALLVTNGGYGTVNDALSHGVPLVVAGAAEDKSEVVARVTWSGVGIGLRTDNPDAPELRRAIETVLGRPKYREAAQRLAQAFHGQDVEREVPRLLEAL